MVFCLPFPLVKEGDGALTDKAALTYILTLSLCPQKLLKTTAGSVHVVFVTKLRRRIG
jgi:hypothetical protein